MNDYADHHDDLRSDEGALTTATTITTATTTTTTNATADSAANDSAISLSGNDAHHGCCEPSHNTSNFSLSMLTDKVAQQLMAISSKQRLQAPPSQPQDCDEVVDQQLEAWMLSHDLVWPEGDYFKATKISMQQGVAQLKRGRRYVFVEPVLGPASSYLYPNHLSHTQEQQEEEEQQHQHEDDVMQADDHLVNETGVEAEMTTATNETAQGQEQTTSQLEIVVSKEVETPRSSSNSGSSPVSASEVSPVSTLATSPHPSSMTTTSSSSSSSSEQVVASVPFDQQEPPYSPLLDGAMDGQDQFEYGLYELTYVRDISYLTPKDFVPTATSFLVRLDEERPTLASPVPASSRQADCRCQLMMRKMVWQRELLQVRECHPPILTVAERRAQREREAMMAQLQLRLEMRALRSGSGSSSSRSGRGRHGHNGAGMRRRRPSLERLAAEWYQHYGSGPPSSWHHHRHHEPAPLLPPPPPPSQQQQRRRSVSRQRRSRRTRRLSASSLTMQMSSEGSAIGEASELSAALESLSIGSGHDEAEHRHVTEEPTRHIECDAEAMQAEVDEARHRFGNRNGEESELGSDTEIDAESSYWPPAWGHYHDHRHGYLPDDGRTRWVDRRRFEMAMTEIGQLEHDQQEEDAEEGEDDDEYEEEEFLDQCGFQNHDHDYDQDATTTTEAATRGRQSVNGLRHSSRRRYISPPPPLRSSSSSFSSHGDASSEPWVYDNTSATTTGSSTTTTTTAMAMPEVSSEGDVSEYMTATSTMRMDQHSNRYGNGSSPPMSSLSEETGSEDDNDDFDEYEEEDCELPMQAYPYHRHAPHRHRDQYPYQHQHPWHMSFMTGHSSLMPLSRLEEDEDDEHGHDPLVHEGVGAASHGRNDCREGYDEDEEEYLGGGGGDGVSSTRRGHMPRQQSRRSAAPPPPLLSPSLAPSFTSTLVYQQHGAAPYRLDHDEFSDEEGDDEHEEEEDEEEEEAGTDEEEGEEDRKDLRDSAEQEVVAEREGMEEPLEEHGDTHHRRERASASVQTPAEMLHERAMAMAMYSYQLPNYQQQFRPRPVEDEPWWDPSPPELSLMQQQQQQQQQHRNHQRPSVRHSTGRPHHHHHHHHHRPSQSAAHPMLGWTPEPILARA
ncbi:hypothetical protein DFQ26_000769 [Actinomortierella ambigua]|nr:hypothetical protein DFQ26_000769 [Actinomortierella ambigua]